MVDLGQIQDLETNVYDDYNEQIRVRGSVEIVEIKDKYALWQGVCGEIKTRKGECQGVDMENYGCDIWKILGQNLIPPVVDQAKFYVKELIPKYEEIIDMDVKHITRMKAGHLKLTVYVKSIFGEIEGDVYVD